MKKFVWIGLLFLLAGILVAELIGNEFLTTYGFLNEYHLKSFANAALEELDVLWNTIWERGKVMLLLVLLCATPFRRSFPKVGIALAGFVAGAFGAACVAQLGVWGILLTLAALLPHGILYGIDIVLLYGLHPAYNFEGKRKNARFFLQILLIIMIFFAACLMETLLGTRLLQIVLRRAF